MDNVKFIKKSAEFIYTPEKNTDTYYQFCQYKNPLTDMYGYRKIVFNQDFKILKSMECVCTKKQMTKFAKSHRINKYRSYPTTDIVHIGIPNPAEMIQVRSSLLNNNITEYDNDRVDFD